MMRREGKHTLETWEAAEKNRSNYNYPTFHQMTLSSGRYFLQEIEETVLIFKDYSAKAIQLFCANIRFNLQPK